ncbi:MAG TPA: site-specific tyrosine recombinase XerD [Phycisphaerae bacterium]|nr:site-specific tyrosine recombinase XerD [Phycisphaerae bacterium]
MNFAGATYPSNGPLSERSWPEAPTEPLGRLLEAFLNYLSIECGLSPNTLSAYRRDLSEFARWLEQRDVQRPQQIEPATVQQHLVALHERGLAVASIARHLVAIRMFLRYLFAQGAMARDVAGLFDSPRQWQRLPRVLSQQDVGQLLAAPCPDDPLYLRDRAILEMLYGTGLRAAELVGLCCQDVNLQVGYVRCLGKGMRERIVPIGRYAVQTVEVYLSQLRPRLARTPAVATLFLSRSGRPLDRHNLWRRVVKHAAQAGISHRVTPHLLRHCFASHLLAGGADLRVVQELLGHVSVVTTQIYTHVDRDRLKAIHARFHPRQ